MSAPKYLVDANVLSEPTKPQPEPRVVEWLRKHEAELAVDPIVVGELRYGVLILPRSKRRSALERWMEGGVDRLQCLTWDARTAQVWAELLAELRRKGRAMPIKDSLVAASAIAHRLTVATRNHADFQYCGVACVNPFEQRK